jgi:hypothetical protein
VLTQLGLFFIKRTKYSETTFVCSTTADIGAGSGWFTALAARRVTGSGANSTATTARLGLPKLPAPSMPHARLPTINLVTTLAIASISEIAIFRQRSV